MSDVTVRRLEPRDLEPVGRLAAQLVRLHHRWDPRRFFLVEPVEDGYRRFLGSVRADPDTVVLVAEVDGEVAGYLYGSVEGRDWGKLLDRHAALHDILVDERFRRRGVGRALLDAAVEAFRDRTERLVLYTAVHNEEAQRLFRAAGFRSTMVEMTKDSQG